MSMWYHRNDIGSRREAPAEDTYHEFSQGKPSIDKSFIKKVHLLVVRKPTRINTNRYDTKASASRFGFKWARSVRVRPIFIRGVYGR